MTEEQQIKQSAISFALGLKPPTALDLVEKAAVIYGFLIEKTQIEYPDGTVNSID